MNRRIIRNCTVRVIQAFDSIDRNKVLESLKYCDDPIKLISLIALTLTDTKAIVKVNNEYSNKFEVHKGVKQGDPLSAALVSIAIDVIIRKLDTRGNISATLKQCAAYADDILITARTKQAMIDTFNKLQMEPMKYGLVINEKKTKYSKTWL
jgi:retron-type reverse transcriptase